MDTDTTPTPPPVDGPLTLETIAAIHGIGVRTVRAWATAGALGEPIGTFRGARGGRRVQVYSPRNVLNHGMRTGRLTDQWTRLGDDGKPLTGRREFKPGYRIRPEPTTDLDGRRYYFLPHVADMFGVTVRTVETWRDRAGRVGGPHPFPAPDLHLDGKPVWHEETLTRWGRDTDRLDEEGRPVLKRNQKA